MSNRDFVDKLIKFSHEGKFYVYFSAVPEGSTYDKEKIPKTDRA